MISRRSYVAFRQVPRPLKEPPGQISVSNDKKGPAVITEMLERPFAISTVGLDLDVRILTSEPAMAALLSSTDNECNTDDQDAHDESL